MLIFFLNLAVEYNKSRDMNNEVLERLKEEYGEDDDLIQLYEDWGDTPYLHEIYHILDEHASDWVLERELGSWAAEFILDILQEHEEDLEEMPETERVALFKEEIEERYADFKSCHQFFCSKSCHNAADSLFCQCFAQTCSRDRIDMSRI